MSETPFELKPEWSDPHQSHGFFHDCRECGATDSVWLTRKKEQTGSTSETHTRVWLICDSCKSGWEKDGSNWSKSGKKSNPRSKTDIINTSRNKNNGLFAKLIVPTQSSGATFTSKGWSVGGSLVRRTSSSGEIKENPYEKYVQRLSIQKEYVEISVVDEKSSIWGPSGGSRTIRLSLSDIINVDAQRIEGNSGFSIEAGEDVYQFKLTRKRLKSASHSDAKDAVNKIMNAISSSGEDSPFAEVSETEKESEGDAINKLSRIKQLHNQGVLTDEEFQEKKEELLDQI